jgi:hypothetical protein
MTKRTQSVTANADDLRDARPTSLFHCRLLPDGTIEIRGVKIRADLDGSFENISDEGYEPNGPNGPTYWRIGRAHSYSTITRDGDFYLIITELDGSGADAHTIAARSEIAVSDVPWDQLMEELARAPRPIEIVYENRWVH